MHLLILKCEITFEVNLAIYSNGASCTEGRAATYTHYIIRFKHEVAVAIDNETILKTESKGLSYFPGLSCCVRINNTAANIYLC